MRTLLLKDGDLGWHQASVKFGLNGDASRDGLTRKMEISWICS